MVVLVIIWNPSNCKFECYKLCGVGEFWDYETCNCRKKLIDKLADKCTENIDEVKSAKITLAHCKNKYKCSAKFVLCYFQ